ncbi:hypothetical protein [Mycobacterium sp.]|uniref:hypothetical protein n=1 Tax=Mycobacterium sp. TaxID=1785 RepID=UPI003F9923F1
MSVQHPLRHIYASLCVAVVIRPIDHRGVNGPRQRATTLDLYVHLFPDDDTIDDMAALGALGSAAAPKNNVIGLGATS